MRLYLDSNVFIAVIRSEVDGAFNPRGLQSEDLFSVCRANKIELVLSDIFLAEIKKKTHFNLNDVNDFFDGIKVKIHWVRTASSKHSLQISQQTGIHFLDAVHVANAIESGCESIITWNKKDFEKTGKLISFFNPVEFVKDIL